MKDLLIFEDYATKSSIKLLDYNNSNSKFQSFLCADNDNEHNRRRNTFNLPK